jgi:hypothetical protein
MAIYCHKQHGEKVSIQPIRELHHQIKNESRKSRQSSSKKFKSKNAQQKSRENVLQIPNRTLLKFKDSKPCFLKKESRFAN